MTLRPLLVALSICLGPGSSMLHGQYNAAFVVTSQARMNNWKMELAAGDNNGAVVALRDPDDAKSKDFALIQGGGPMKILPSDAAKVELRRSAKVRFKTTLRLLDDDRNQVLLDCELKADGTLALSDREWRDAAGNSLVFPTGGKPIEFTPARVVGGKPIPWCLTITRERMVEDAQATQGRGRSTTITGPSGKK